MKPVIIGIAGASCAGKTVLALRVAERLGPKQTIILPVDAYYRSLDHLSPAARADWNFDSPEAIEHDLFVRQLSELAKGRPIQRPQYDFTTHTRRPDTIEVAPLPFILVEGLFALYWKEARHLMRVKAFITAASEVCLERRLQRDQEERGRTRDSVLNQFQTTVEPMYAKYCQPTRTFANLILDGTHTLETLTEKLAKRIEDVSH